ncbi:putative MFS family arabinose efflux permease [Herbihabitans rhizosphaerae]|uniref:Putative MFS family arabinose efflux permease n=1 Tax=Herbihabitans rhizosphaerae TaxID=1872711 RepID=A0A4Q7KHN3_9PSEU|nr:MFS transporter [Herbihabitans rhizosphaerae]RZS34411.1 putative MFS family arabinose efflux permease [Herbihabitans rhizosphaerae]
MTVGAPPRLGHRTWLAVGAVALTATVGVLPGFAVGALAAFVEPDLRVSRPALGLAMSVFYAATALGSPVAKRIAARLPAAWVLAAAALTASATMLAVSQVDGEGLLIAVLAVGGFANGLVQPVAGRLIAVKVHGGRRSLAAGLVGAALGAGPLIAGLLVALVAVPHGWRAAMIAGAVVALLPLTLLRHVRGVGAAVPGQPKTGRVGGVLVLWGAAAALSAVGNNAVATYFVQLGTHAGMSTSLSGNLLSLSAFLAIAVRLGAGVLTDRAPARLPAVITAMMACGAVGLALIATGTSVGFLAGAVLAFTAGWGWTGLLLAATIRLLPGRTENAGHTVQSGLYTGAAVAPFSFGALSSAYGFGAAALAGAVAGVVAAALLAAGARLAGRG